MEADNKSHFAQTQGRLGEVVASNTNWATEEELDQERHTYSSSTLKKMKTVI